MKNGMLFAIINGFSKTVYLMSVEIEERIDKIPIVRTWLVL
jgi:hypothetical protein